MEEGYLLLESLDSLWFFSNLFSSRTHPIYSLSSEEITNVEDPLKPTEPIVDVQQNESPKMESLSPRKPMKPVVHSHQKESPKSPTCAKCGEFGQSESQLFPAVEGVIVRGMEFQKHGKKEERGRSRRRKRKGKRKVLGELDLGFDMRDYDAWGMNYKANACGFGMFGGQVKMPPLSDGMAMKQHLKSWAYAVACTVR